MRRADRLFRIIEILRRSRRPTTAERIAAELEVSKRTVYRDIADLMANRTPIAGEAGVGYVLDRDFDMPPLMLTGDELEAAALGAQWVAGQGDAALARAARDLIAKIAAVTPERLRPFALEPSVEAAPPLVPAAGALDVAAVRAAIRRGFKMRIRYRNEALRESERVIWPVLIGYVGTARLLAAWCELRSDFRHFRLDRIDAAEVLEARIPARPALLRARWRAHWEAQSAGTKLAIDSSRPAGAGRSAPP